jgi:hypothetical protein
MASRRGTVDRVLDVAFAIVAVVAGIVGVVMLMAPGSTGDYFSWELGPPPLASLVGGLYVASTVVFGLAIAQAWGAVRGLVAGVLALTLPTLAATLIHSEVFDFSRAVAVIWLILFVASPLTYGSILVLRRTARVAGGPPLPGRLRMSLGALAVVLTAFGLLTWVDRTAAEELVPFALAPMGAKFLGAWSLFLAVLAAWAASAGRRDEARIPLVGLLAYAVGALGAGLRSLGDLDETTRWPWLAAFVVIAALAGGVLSRSPSVEPAVPTRAGRRSRLAPWR